METKREPTENERKKNYLWQYQLSVRRVRMIESELEEVRSMKLGASSLRFEGIGGGCGNGDLSGYAAKLDAIERKLIQERYRRITLYEEVNDAINAVGNEQERNILFYRYVKGMGWREIAEKMSFTERWVQILHGKALTHFKIPIK